MRARLILEDGTVYEGEAFGACGDVLGEIVFNTSMTGYQEVLTDPSYCGQIVAMTYPLIGNYGFHPDHQESQRPHVRGFIVREHSRQPNHWKNHGGAEVYLNIRSVAAQGDSLRGIDSKLGPEMKSTGEVIGWDRTYENAMYNSLLAAGTKFHRGGTLVALCSAESKVELRTALDTFRKRGFHVWEPVSQAIESILQAMRSGEVSLLITTQSMEEELALRCDLLREEAILRGITCFTSTVTFLAYADAYTHSQGVEYRALTFERHFHSV